MIFDRDQSSPRMSGASAALLGAVLSLLGSSPPAAAADRMVYVLTVDQRIATVPVALPGQATSAVAVTGLVAGDALMAIDVRPQNGRLYGLGFNSANGTVRLYHLTVDSAVARATALGASGSFIDGAGMPAPIAGTAFGMDFNPVADRLRVNNNGGQNFRMNPNSGAFIDGDLGGAAGSVTGLNMDGAINGGTVTVDDAAYTNNSINTAVTTLYTLDSFSNTLWIQNPPNAGTQTLPVVLTLAGSPLDFSAECGLDIPLGVNVAALNAAASGDAFAALTVAGVSGLYRVNLATGAATALGSFGVPVRDLAVTPETATADALTSTGTQLARMLLQDPSSAVFVTLNGITAGERLVGIDGRPANGQLMGLGVNPTANTATVYLIDLQIGTATTIGAASSIAYVDAMGAPVDLPDGSWGFDFNPTVDRLRVVSSSGLNFRVNPITGAPVDGDLGGMAGSVAGINPDGPINGIVAATLAGAAYTNNVAGATVTTLYTLDPGGNRLSIQNPPNLGTQTAPRAVTLNGLPFDFDFVSGFDIPPGVNAASANAEAVGEGYAVLSAGATTSLYRIDLPTGAAHTMGTVGNGTVQLEGLTVWNSPLDTLFADGFE